MLPMNVAPLALIPALNVLSSVNVFAPRLAPTTAPVFPLKEVTPVFVKTTNPVTPDKLIPAPAIAPVTPNISIGDPIVIVLAAISRVIVIDPLRTKVIVPVTPSMLFTILGAVIPPAEPTTIDPATIKSL